MPSQLAAQVIHLAVAHIPLLPSNGDKRPPLGFYFLDDAVEGVSALNEPIFGTLGPIHTHVG